MAIDGINGTIGLNTLGGAKSIGVVAPNIKSMQDTSGAEGVSFANVLSSALENVNQLQLDADSIANDFAVGKTDDIAGVMIAADKADTALQFTMQVRNKILDAYNEIMRISI